MKQLLSDDDIFVIPSVIPEMSSKKGMSWVSSWLDHRSTDISVVNIRRAVLTTELLDGQPIEHVVKADQKTRDMVPTPP
jgi:hypothetical protein